MITLSRHNGSASHRIKNMLMDYAAIKWPIQCQRCVVRVRMEQYAHLDMPHSDPFHAALTKYLFVISFIAKFPLKRANRLCWWRVFRRVCPTPLRLLAATSQMHKHSRCVCVWKSEKHPFRAARSLKMICRAMFVYFRSSRSEYTIAMRSLHASVPHTNLSLSFFVCVCLCVDGCQFITMDSSPACSQE